MILGISPQLGVWEGKDKKNIDLHDITFINKMGIKFLEPEGDEIIPADVKRYMAKNNMGYCSLHCEHDLSEGGDEQIRSIESIKKNIDTIKKLGGKLIVVHPSVNPYENSRDERINNAIKGIAKVAEYACINNINVAIENLPSDSKYCWLGDSIEELDYILKKVIELSGKNNTLGICLDIGHAFTSGDLYQYFDRFRNNILELHIHDNFGKKKNDEWVKSHDRHYPPGLGKINWGEVFNKLIKIKFNGLFVFEV